MKNILIMLMVFWLVDSVVDLNNSPEFKHGIDGLVAQSDGFVFINRNGFERISVWAN